jgi:hypothetical protein
MIASLSEFSNFSSDCQNVIVVYQQYKIWTVSMFHIYFGRSECCSISAVPKGSLLEGLGWF